MNDKLPSSKFDDEDMATLRDVIIDHRKRQAVRSTVASWGKYFLVASGVLVALVQLRDFLRSLLQIKGGP